MNCKISCNIIMTFCFYVINIHPYKIQQLISKMKISVSFQDNREMPCVADNRKASPPAVENNASGNFKDILRDIVGFIFLNGF